MFPLLYSDSRRQHPLPYLSPCLQGLLPGPLVFLVTTRNDLSAAAAIDDKETVSRGGAVAGGSLAVDWQRRVLIGFHET